MLRPFRIIRYGLYLALAATLIGAVAGAGVWFYIAPQLPSIEILKDMRLQVPLRVHTQDGRLIAEFGEKRRVPVTLRDVPETMVQAVLAAEDDRFYQHPGVDWQGLVRAAWHLLKTGKKGQGGSTITMQVARNFFLGREKTYIRKLKEILLAFKIEHGLSKDEILELYLNKIYLGHRAYGVGAAAQVYYGNPLKDLDLAEMSMIAGLPKAPSRFNPIVSPERALLRRRYVLRRMHELGFINDGEYTQANSAPVTARLHGLAIDTAAPYIAEMVRADLVDRYGVEAYTAGYSVYTSIDSRLQVAADRALRDALQAYDERHGYRGPEHRVSISRDDEPGALDRVLGDIDPVAGLRPALVTAVEDKQVVAYQRGVNEFIIPWEGMAWARPYKSENRRGPNPKAASEILAPGDVIWVRLNEEGVWRLAQVPVVEGALVSLNPRNGAIVALSGGLDFYRSKFNRVTQARRQPGSNFKPFIYSAALDAGFTAASQINDAPVVFDDPGLEAAWRPENYGRKFFGPTRLRKALEESRNLVSIRLLRAVGVKRAIEYVQRFGFDTKRLPRNLSLALGSGAVSPLELVTGYAVFANGGFLVKPYFLERILDSRGEVVFITKPVEVCRECEKTGEELDADVSAGESIVSRPSLGSSKPARPAKRVVSPQNSWLMTSLLRGVVKRGTGRRALQLKRGDLAGKTGTTNDQRDAWFSGFNQHLVTTAWVGFDKLRPLGNRETGGRAALPMWIGFMEKALNGVPEVPLETPKGLVTVRIDPKTGLLAAADFPDAVFETFRIDRIPKQMMPQHNVAENGGTSSTSEEITEKLF